MTVHSMVFELPALQALSASGVQMTDRQQEPGPANLQLRVLPILNVVVDLVSFSLGHFIPR